MGLTSRIKKIRSKLGNVKRRSGGGSGGVKRRRGGSARDASSSGPGRAPRRAELSRSKGTRDLLASGSDARGARADARADLKPWSAPKVGKPPALKRSKAVRDVNKAGKTADSAGKFKRDLTTGRALFPAESGGKTQYLPIESEATPRERKLGLFVKDASVTKDPPKTFGMTGKSVFETHSGRTLFAIETADGKNKNKTEYLPKKSDATASELSRGKYVPDSAVEAPSKGNKILDETPLFEFANQRDLFATETADGDREYLPKRSDATALELKEGRYVNDEDISQKAPLGAANSMSAKKPRYDIGQGRKVFAIKTKDGKTRYLPSESDATAFEKTRGLFIPDDIVDRHERKRGRTALKDDDADHALRRAQRADKLFGGVTSKNLDTAPDPVTEAKDGSKIWDGAYPPEVSDKKQRETLLKLKPKYDLGKGRMVYPTETAKGKIEYLPLLDDATTDERIDGRYAAFVPPEPLRDFLENEKNQNDLKRQTFDTELGEVNAWSQEDIEKAFEDAPTLVLRSASLVAGAARQNPALRQQWL